MKPKTKNKTALSIGIFSAIAASMCCIAPLLAFIAGVSGLATTFSWLEPARPVFIGITIVILAIAWYQKLKTGASCTCENGKTPFLQTKLFLIIITVLAAALLSFPYYAGAFYPKAKPPITTLSDIQDIQYAEFKIEGMTCDGCVAHVNHALGKVDGILDSSASYENGSAKVEFDASITSLEEITKAIDATGYKVKESYLKEKKLWEKKLFCNQ